MWTDTRMDTRLQYKVCYVEDVLRVLFALGICMLSALQTPHLHCVHLASHELTVAVQLMYEHELNSYRSTMPDEAQLMPAALQLCRTKPRSILHTVSGYMTQGTMPDSFDGAGAFS